MVKPDDYRRPSSVDTNNNFYYCKYLNRINGYNED